MAQSSQAETSTTTGYRVLIVEDEVLLGIDIQTMLGRAGYDVVGPLRTIASALSAVKWGKIDVALLDLNLSGEMSYVVADALVAKAIPFIIMSGYSKDSVPERYRQHPALPKPFLEPQLVETLQQVFNEPDRARSVGAD